MLQVNVAAKNLTALLRKT